MTPLEKLAAKMKEKKKKCETCGLIDCVCPKDDHGRKGDKHTIDVGGKPPMYVRDVIKGAEMQKLTETMKSSHGPTAMGWNKLSGLMSPHANPLSNSLRHAAMGAIPGAVIGAVNAAPGEGLSGAASGAVTGGALGMFGGMGHDAAMAGQSAAAQKYQGFANKVGPQIQAGIGAGMDMAHQGINGLGNAMLGKQAALKVFGI